MKTIKEISRFTKLVDKTIVLIRLTFAKESSAFECEIFVDIINIPIKGVINKSKSNMFFLTTRY